MPNEVKISIVDNRVTVGVAGKDVEIGTEISDELITVRVSHARFQHGQLVAAIGKLLAWQTGEGHCRAIGCRRIAQRHGCGGDIGASRKVGQDQIIQAQAGGNVRAELHCQSVHARALDSAIIDCHSHYAREQGCQVVVLDHVDISERDLSVPREVFV